MMAMKIMLIDDEFECMAGLSGAIEPAGYSCDIFTQPEKAVTAYSQKHYDLVISDMRMPVMNGIEVLVAIRKMNPSARVIMLSSHSDRETVTAAAFNGAYAFLLKPVDIAEVIEIVEKIIQERVVSNSIFEDRERLVAAYIRLKNAYGELQVLLGEQAFRRAEQGEMVPSLFGSR